MGAPSPLPFPLDQNFFGFKPKDRVEFHDSIFNLIWWGEGRWDWDTIYNMPVHIRRRWIKHINAIIQTKQPKPGEGSTSGKKKKR